MEKETQDVLLSRYFNEPGYAPPRLVADTLRRISAAERMGVSLTTVAVLQGVILILVGVCLLTAPVPLMWKLALLPVFCLVQTCAAAVLLFFLSGMPGTAKRV